MNKWHLFISTINPPTLFPLSLSLAVFFPLSNIFPKRDFASSHSPHPPAALLLIRWLWLVQLLFHSPSCCCCCRILRCWAGREMSAKLCLYTRPNHTTDRQHCGARTTRCVFSPHGWRRLMFLLLPAFKCITFSRCFFFFSFFYRHSKDGGRCSDFLMGEGSGRAAMLTVSKSRSRQWHLDGRLRLRRGKDVRVPRTDHPSRQLASLFIYQLSPILVLSLFFSLAHRPERRIYNKWLPHSRFTVDLSAEKVNQLKILDVSPVRADSLREMTRRGSRAHNLPSPPFLLRFLLSLISCRPVYNSIIQSALYCSS